MCKAIQDMIKDGEERGIEYGIERGIERGVEGMIKLCQEFGASMELTIQKLVAQFTFSEDKATEYIQKYWN